jgi:hypothetical protein
LGDFWVTRASVPRHALAILLSAAYNFNNNYSGGTYLFDPLTSRSFLIFLSIDNNGLEDGQI